MLMSRVFKGLRSSRAPPATVDESEPVANEGLDPGCNRAHARPFAAQSEAGYSPDHQDVAQPRHRSRNGETPTIAAIDGVPGLSRLIRAFPSRVLPTALRNTALRGVSTPPNLPEDLQRQESQDCLGYEATPDPERYDASFPTPDSCLCRQSSGTENSVSTCHTARSDSSSTHLARDESAVVTGRESRSEESETSYRRAIRELCLAVPWFEELNWSGRGQHVEYEEGELVPLEMTVKPSIGRSMTAKVEQVRCEGVFLARKTRKRDRRMTFNRLLSEARHLKRLDHPHIVRLIGTYRQGRQISILMYPVATYNLARFLDLCDPCRESPGRVTIESKTSALRQVFGCLAAVIAYVHEKHIVHMDIKPANILVVDSRKYSIREGGYHVYLCDFGLSREFFLRQSESADYVGMTTTYAAPEVANYRYHGRKSDIFSLGCVFLEMATILAVTPENCSDLNLEEFAVQRRASREANDDSFHDNPLAVAAWIAKLAVDSGQGWHGHAEPMLALIKQMLAPDPDDRPTAQEICQLLPPNDCCLQPRAPIQMSWP